MKQWMIGFSLFCLANTVAWANLAAYPTDVQDGWYIQASGGTSNLHLSKNNYVFTGPKWPRDKYVVRNEKKTALASIGIGYRWNNWRKWFPFYTFGVVYTNYFNSKVNGLVYQYSLPQFQNYTYIQHINRQTIMAVLKGDIYRFHFLMPYLSVGAGISINNTHAYQDFPTNNVTARVSPGFKSHSYTYLSYMVAAGLDLIVRSNITASLEYNWGYYGYARTARGVKTSTVTGYNFANSRLKNQLTASAALLTVSYSLDLC